MYTEKLNYVKFISLTYFPIYIFINFITVVISFPQSIEKTALFITFGHATGI